MKKTLIFIQFISLSIILFSCKNDNFSPFVKLDQSISVFCILDNRNEKQIFYVQKGYQLDGIKSDTNDQWNVSISNSLNENYPVRDTVINPNSVYRTFYTPNFSFKRGVYYYLNVKHGSGSESASIWVPAVANPTITQRFDTVYVKDGWVVNFNVQIKIPGDYPRISGIRMYMEYEQKINGKAVNKIFQIPIVAQGLSTKSQFELTEFQYLPLDYSSLVKELVIPTYDEPGKNWSTTYYSVTSGYHYFNLPLSYFFWIFREIGKDCNPEDITIKKVYLIYYSMSEYYYEKYMVSRAEAEYSVRLGDPLIETNFLGSKGTVPVGIFTFVTVDTTKIKIHNYFMNAFGYKNGQ